MELYHHGIQGQKWGKRLYQNPDGSLTPLGRLRYGSSNKSKTNKQTKNKKTNNALPPSEKLKQDLRKKNISKMSDDELRAFTKRYDTLREVERRLSEGEKKSVKRKVFELVAKSAELAVGDILKETMKDLGKQAIKKSINKMR